MFSSLKRAIIAVPILATVIAGTLPASAIAQPLDPPPNNSHTAVSIGCNITTVANQNFGFSFYGSDYAANAYFYYEYTVRTPSGETGSYEPRQIHTSSNGIFSTSTSYGKSTPGRVTVNVVVYTSPQETQIYGAASNECTVG